MILVNRKGLFSFEFFSLGNCQFQMIMIHPTLSRILIQREFFSSFFKNFILNAAFSLLQQSVSFLIKW